MDTREKYLYLAGFTSGIAAFISSQEVYNVLLQNKQEFSSGPFLGAIGLTIIAIISAAIAAHKK